MIIKTQKEQQKLLVAGILILLGILFRTVWHAGDNIEFVTAAALLSGAYLGKRWAIGVPLLIMIISDSILGNTNIFLFTWSAYILIGVIGYFTLGQKSQPKADRPMDEKLKIENILKATGTGIGASVFFYLWTNFGVWFLDSWGMYPKTLQGLIDAYILGLPFFKSNVLGNLFFVPLVFFIAAYGKRFTTNMQILHFLHAGIYPLRTKKQS